MRMPAEVSEHGSSPMEKGYAPRVHEPPAEANYRGFVGPADQYDVIGAAQLALLYALGLREHHRLLDIGCGSLRGGRMLIPYLASGGYVGVEPNRWLIDAAIEHQLGQDIVDIKRPVFDESNDFELGHLGRFDYVLGQGIATNTGPRLLRKLLSAIRGALAPAGLAAITIIHPGTGDQSALHVRMGDNTADAWRYPGCYSYDRSEIAAAVRSESLVGQPIPWFHPRHQWWLLAGSEEALPPNQFVAALNGATRAEGWDASWKSGGQAAGAENPR